ncbi:hypothetical protein GIB67_012686 [Kingdonia uniflora]|uniref:Uncharacterized protein n=1 Tax=Kingdonia uniflora TaxID=39325 RepID=A0A7J7NEW1_9MAGN|nr:hypothetical protein GIB67_012686 [Kingdonia uniflora]
MQLVQKLAQEMMKQTSHRKVLKLIMKESSLFILLLSREPLIVLHLQQLLLVPLLHLQVLRLLKRIEFVVTVWIGMMDPST